MINGLSLFSNVGMAETYLKEIGIDIVVANELLPERANFYRHLYPKCNMITGDITDKSIFEEVYNKAKQENVDLSVISPVIILHLG